MLLWVPAARAEPTETALSAFTRVWDSMRRVVALEGRPRVVELAPPLDEQRIRMRRELLPMLEGELQTDLKVWLDEIDEALTQFNFGHFRTFKQVLVHVQKKVRKPPVQTSPGFELRWLRDPVARKLKVWAPLRWDPLMRESARAITEAEELLVVLSFPYEPYSTQDFGWPRRTRIWMHMGRAKGQEAVERELARREASRQVGSIYRKHTLVATLRQRVDGWIIERLEWQDFPLLRPGAGR